MSEPPADAPVQGSSARSAARSGAGSTVFVSRRLEEQGLRPGFVYREAPDDARDSGWRVLVGDESTAEADDPRAVLILDLTQVRARWPQLGPLLDGSDDDGAWAWDDAQGAFARVAE